MMQSFGLMFFALMPLLLPPQPKSAPISPQVMVSHLPSECQYVATADLSTLLPHIFSAANKITNHPFVRSNAKIRRRVMRGMMMVNMQRAGLRKQLGFDPVTAIRYAAVGMHMGKKRRSQRVVAVLGGTFSAGKVATQLARMMGTRSAPVSLKDGFSYIDGGRRNPTLGWYAKGPLFIGKSKHLISFAKAGSLRPSKPALNSAAAKLVANYLPRSIVSVGFSPSPAMLQKMLRRAPGVMKKLFGSMSYAQAALQYNGSSLLIENPDAAARTKYTGLLRAMGLMAKAGDFLTRALIQFADTLLDPTDASLPRTMRELAKHKATLLPLLRKQMGAAPMNFKIWPTGNQVNMQLLGNPGLGVFGLGGVFGYLTMATRRSRTMSRPARVYPSRAYKRPTRSQTITVKPTPKPAARKIAKPQK